MHEDDIETAAKAMMRDIAKTKNYSHGCLLMFEPRYPDNVCVRGHIDLYALARAALLAVERKHKKRYA